MMNIRIKKIFSSILNNKSPSILLLFSPYITQNFNLIKNSKFYSHWKLFTFLLIIILIQILFSNLYKKKDVLLKLLLLFTYSLFTTFIYGLDLIHFLEKINISLIISIRGREILLLLFLFIFLLNSWLCLKLNIPSLQNNFWTILTFTSLSFSYTKIPIQIGKNHYIQLNEENKINTPVILIILDEYSSPDELHKVCLSNDLSFMSNQLLEMGFIVKNSFLSNETFTVKSISSLLNFNQTDNYTFSKSNSIKFSYEELFVNSQLIDSLISKDVGINNYSIFNLGKTTTKLKTQYYPNSFFSELLKGTIYSNTIINIKNYNYPSKFQAEYNTTKNNLELIDILPKLNLASKQFVYAHFLMPHPPFEFGKEFKYKSNNLINYIEFWKFTNLKILPLLKSLSQKNIKIILTGDHGYRNDNKINPKLTFAVFWGFSEKSIKEVLTVQDIGSLVCNQFRE